jgi:serine protease Do
VLLFVLVGLGFLLAAGGACVWVFLRARESLRTEAAETTRSTRNLPPVTREVPHHRLSVLDGCSDSDLRTLVEGIDAAISVGAPLYNSGNFAGCYHLYSGTAADLERRLSSACTGPVHALAAGRERAGSLDDPSGQAWAMRDAFDGLLDVVERRESRH